jgi:hypothetical protein
MATKLAPENVQFKDDGSDFTAGARYNLQACTPPPQPPPVDRPRA